MSLSVGIRVEGMPDVERVFSRIPFAIHEAMRDVTQTVRRLVMGRTPVASGTLKKSWSPISQATNGFTFTNEASYASILEEGRYRGVGPRTVRHGSGIFSRQSVDNKGAGMIWPVIDDPGLIEKIAQMVAAEIRRGL